MCMFFAWLGVRAFAHRRYRGAAETLSREALTRCPPQCRARAARARIFVLELGQSDYMETSRGTHEAITEDDVVAVRSVVHIARSFWNEEERFCNRDVSMMDGDSSGPGFDFYMKSIKLRRLCRHCARYLADRGDIDEAFQICEALFIVSAAYREAALDLAMVGSDCLSLATGYHDNAQQLLQEFLLLEAKPSSERLWAMADVLCDVRKQSVIPDCIPSHVMYLVEDWHAKPYALMAVNTHGRMWDQDWAFILLGLFCSSAMVDLDGCRLAYAVDRWLMMLDRDPTWSKTMADINQQATNEPCRWPLYKVGACSFGGIGNCIFGV